MNTPLPDPSDFHLLEHNENMRQHLRNLQALSAHMQHQPDWPLHFARLDELDRLIRSGTREDLERMCALHDDFLLAMEADLAPANAEVMGSLVGVLDDIARQVEEKKFEVPSEVRDGMEDLLQPYHDGLREQMLGEIPLEDRRKIEGTEGRPDGPS